MFVLWELRSNTGTINASYIRSLARRTYRSCKNESTVEIVRMDQDIELFVSSCKVCQTGQRVNKSILISWKEGKYGFERIHVDFRKISNKTLLVTLMYIQS